MDDGGEADDDGGLNTGSAKEVGASEVRDVMGDLKEALGAGSTGVDDALRHPLPREVGNLLHQVIVLQQNGTC